MSHHKWVVEWRFAYIKLFLRTSILQSEDNRSSELQWEFGQLLRLQIDILLLLPTMLGAVSVLDPLEYKGFHHLQENLQHRCKPAGLLFCESGVFLLPLYLLNGALGQLWEANLLSFRRKMAWQNLEMICCCHYWQKWRLKTRYM